MKRSVFGIFASIALAGTLVAAQDYPSPSSQPQQEPQSRPQPQAPAAQPQTQEKAPEATLVGCLIQGSGPAVFVLENAKVATDASDAKGKTFIVDTGGSSIDLKTQLNRQVRIVGMAETKAVPAPAAGQKVNEKDLPKLSAKVITVVADTCAVAG